MPAGQWVDVQTIDSKHFTCGYCGNYVASDKGYITTADHPIRNHPAYGPIIYVCPHCQLPTAFIPPFDQVPRWMPGRNVDSLPKDVEALYKEARSCLQVGAATASVLCSRKLLMNIAVSLGDAQGRKFVQYIDYLDAAHYIPPNGKAWVNVIRDKGNEATHEIAMKTEDDARQLLDFLEMLLRFIYEFPAMVKPKTK